MKCPWLGNRQRLAASLWFLLGAWAAACDPYGTFNDPDQSLGAVDPVNFPPGSIGIGGDRKRPGRGALVETAAFVANESVGYFTYPVPTAGVADPLRVLEDDKPVTRVATPRAYVFDPGDDNPIPDDYPCTAPPGYRYNQQRDEV